MVTELGQLKVYRVDLTLSYLEARDSLLGLFEDAILSYYT